MFKISRRLDYGLQLMISLAEAEDDRAQSTASISEKLSIPLPFLHQIAHSLMQAGYIKATPGPRGGLRLNYKPESMTILQIVEALEGTLSLNPAEECPHCEDDGQSTTQQLWNNLQAAIGRHLENITLDMLLKQHRKAGVYILSMEQAKQDPAELHQN